MYITALSTTRVVISAEVHRVSLFRFLGRLVISTSTGGKSVVQTAQWIGRAGAEREVTELAQAALDRCAIRGESDVVLLGLAEGLEVTR